MGEKITCNEKIKKIFLAFVVIGTGIALPSLIAVCVIVISSANTKRREDKTVDSQFVLAVEDIDHLGKVLSAIKKVKGVLEVKRIYN